MKKPEITRYDGGGFHNADLAATHSRLYKGNTWKNQRIVTIIPAGPTIPPKVYLSHLNLQHPPNQPVVRFAAEGYEVGQAYSQMIENVINHPELSKWEYILTLEHDNLPPADGLIRLMQRLEDNPKLSAVSGLYYTKGYSGVAQIWGDPNDPVLNFRPMPPDPNGGLVECCGTGMGFTLFRMSMFKDKNLRRPWFETRDGHTQDLWFWSDARKNGHRCAVDCSVKVGHYDHEGKFGPPGMVW